MIRSILSGKNILFAVLLVLTLSVNIVRLWGLDKVPGGGGLQIDEQTFGVYLACLAEGTPPMGEKQFPFFERYSSDGSPTPPTYLYPGMLWAKIFGFSPAALRALTVFSFLLALWGMFLIGSRLYGRAGGMWVLLAGSLSPWTWVLCRIAWESFFMLPFFVWGLFFCLKGKRTLDLIIAGVFLSAAAYSYPPARLQVPLFLIVMVAYGYGRMGWRFRHVLALGFSFFLASIPLLTLYLTTNYMSARFSQIG
ncbi:MAG: glycosyltransferase family 39 protein, partial [Elusimicrobia bacterium]|nr:glycosyltransferase family 39 protein [Elusimicrobiota bacterium]